MPSDRRITDCDGLLREVRARYPEASISPTSNGHYKIVGPAGTATISPKWGDPRARQNAIADVRRYAGIDVSVPVEKAPSPADIPPKKLSLSGSRPALSYTTETEDTDMNATNGQDISASSPVTRDDHDALLVMLQETAASLRGEMEAMREHFSSRLNASIGEVARNITAARSGLQDVAVTVTAMNRRVDALAAMLRPVESEVEVETSYVPRMRRKVAEFLETMPPSLWLPRASIAEGIGVDDTLPERKQLSHVLRTMALDDEVEQTGTRATSRWRLLRATDGS